MRRRLPIALAVGLLALLGAAVAHGELTQKGDVRISFDAAFSPQALPRDRLAPVSVELEGKIITTDETHPPAVRQLEFEINRAGRLSTVGLPVCRGGQLQATTTGEALRRCRPALVGRGRFGAHLDFPGSEEVPAHGTALVFNGRKGGHPAMFIQLYATSPVQITFVMPLLITHRPTGQFGTVLSARVPPLANGLGSVTEVHLKIGRTYTYKGQRRGFISASCAAPAGFNGGSFPFVRGQFHFVGGRTLTATLARSCRVAD